jgi:hypothetical protein
MLRKLLLLIALLVVAAIVLVWMNVIDIDWNQNAEAPVAVQLNPVNVGTTTTNVQVPVVGTETRQVEVPSLTVGGNETQGNAQR